MACFLAVLVDGAGGQLGLLLLNGISLAGFGGAAKEAIVLIQLDSDRQGKDHPTSDKARPYIFPESHVGNH